MTIEYWGGNGGGVEWENFEHPCFWAKNAGGGFKNDEKLKKKLQNDKEKRKKRKKRRKIEKNDAKKSAFKHVSSACLTGSGKQKIRNRGKFRSQNDGDYNVKMGKIGKLRSFES